MILLLLLMETENVYLCKMHAVYVNVMLVVLKKLAFVVLTLVSVILNVWCRGQLIGRGFSCL